MKDTIYSIVYLLKLYPVLLADEVEQFLASESSMLTTPSPDVTLQQSTAVPLPSELKSIPSPVPEAENPALDASEEASSESPLIMSSVNQMGPSGDSSSQMHSFIGEAIYKENQDKDDDYPDSPSKSADSISTPSSVSAAASESPQQESTMQAPLESDATESWDLDDNGDSQQSEKKKYFEAERVVDSQSGKHGE